MQIGWRLCRQRDEVTERFVESFIGAGSEELRLLLVGPEINDMSELVMHGMEIFGIDVKAALQAHIVLAVERPGVRPAADIAVLRSRKHRTLVEALRYGIKAERDVEILRGL